MLHRAFSLVLLLSAFSVEVFAHHPKASASSTVGKGNQLAAASSCAAPSVTVTVTASANAVSATSTAKAGSGSSSSSGGNNGSKGGAAGNNNAKTTAAAAKTTAAAAKTSSAATAISTGTAGNVAATDPSQSSQTLLQSVIATGFASDGQETPTAGQVASLTSTNNFINFCATTNLPITNGQQIKTGSCNPAPMGMIAPQTKMPTAKFVNPPNLGTIAANTPFTITMAVNNLNAGHFVNAASNYYSAPQQLDAKQVIIGHSHFVIEPLQSMTQTTPLDNTKFSFFQGVNTPVDSKSQLNVDVTDGLPAGVYRLGSINAAANHQPVLVAVAQHGLLDDVVYFTVTDNGAAANKSAAAAAAAAKAAGGKTSKKTRRSRRNFHVAREAN